jgi:hypothetical protein
MTYKSLIIFLCFWLQTENQIKKSEILYLKPSNSTSFSKYIFKKKIHQKRKKRRCPEAAHPLA